MSLVLVTAVEDYIIMMSDGRVTRTEYGMNLAVDENFKKLARVNDSVCIGFAGSKEPCEEAVLLLNGYDKKSLSLEEIFKIVYESSKKVYKKYTDMNVEIKILMAVGGKNSENNIEFKTFSSDEKFEVNVHKPGKGDLYFTDISPTSTDKIYSSLLAENIIKNQPITIENLKKSMEESIDKASEIDFSINKNKFVEVIRR